jgi:hypothetical protein
LLLVGMLQDTFKLHQFVTEKPKKCRCDKNIDLVSKVLDNLFKGKNFFKKIVIVYWHTFYFLERIWHIVETVGHSTTLTWTKNDWLNWFSGKQQEGSNNFTMMLHKVFFSITRTVVFRTCAFCVGQKANANTY